MIVLSTTAYRKQIFMLISRKPRPKTTTNASSVGKPNDYSFHHGLSKADLYVDKPETKTTTNASSVGKPNDCSFHHGLSEADLYVDKPEAKTTTNTAFFLTQTDLYVDKPEAKTTANTAFFLTLTPIELHLKSADRPAQRVMIEKNDQTAAPLPPLTAAAAAAAADKAADGRGSTSFGSCQ